MSCRACHDLLQRHLDGDGGLEAGALDEHLRDCPACRTLLGAARHLGEGLRLLAPPAPPPGLADRIVTGVARDRRRRRRVHRLRAFAVALAAGLLVAVAARVWWGGKGPAPIAPVEASPGPGRVAKGAAPPAPAPGPRLHESVAEAGSAVASLTSRTADETVGPTRLFIPAVGSPLDDLDAGPSVEPPTEPFREAGAGVSLGLEPVTSSARRAVGLFLRDLPPVGADDKAGL